MFELFADRMIQYEEIRDKRDRSFLSDAQNVSLQTKLRY